MSDIEPALLDEWEAMYRLEPWGDDWEQAAMIAAAVKNKGSEDPIAPQTLIPNEETRQRIKAEEAGTGLPAKYETKYKGR